MKLIRIYVYFAIPFALLIIFASLLTTKPYLTMSKGLYESHDDVFFDHDYAIDRIIGYLNYEFDNLAFGVDENDNSPILRQIEIDHMVDVKNLYTNLRIAAGVSLILAVLLLIYMRKKDELEFYITLKNIYFGPLFFTIFVGGYLLIDFNAAFTKFHELFFTNDDWILYSTDVLIILLPTNFWMVSGLIILILFSFSIASIVYINEKIHKTLTKK